MSKFKNSRTTDDNLCLFRALEVHLHGLTNLETSNSKIFNDFLEKSGCDPKLFRGVSMDNLPIVEDLAEKNIFIYDIDLEKSVNTRKQ